MPPLADRTPCCTRPLEAFWLAVFDTLNGFMKIFWNASWVPDAAVRTNRSIPPPTLEPGTLPQSRVCPEKIDWTCACDRFPTVLDLLVIRQMPSWAILLKTSPPGSLGFGSRDELPIDTRPRATSETPTSEPPWSSLNWTQWLHEPM